MNLDKCFPDIKGSFKNFSPFIQFPCDLTDFRDISYNILINSEPKGELTIKKKEHLVAINNEKLILEMISNKVYIRPPEKDILLAIELNSSSPYKLNVLDILLVGNYIIKFNLKESTFSFWENTGVLTSPKKRNQSRLNMQKNQNMKNILTLHQQ